MALRTEPAKSEEAFYVKLRAEGDHEPDYKDEAYGAKAWDWERKPQGAGKDEPKEPQVKRILTYVPCSDPMHPLTSIKMT